MKKFFKIGCLSVVGLVVLIFIIGLIATMVEDDTQPASTQPDSSQTENSETNTESAAEKESQEKPEEEAQEQTEEEEKANAFEIGDVAVVGNVGFQVQEVNTTEVIDSGNEFIENATTSGKFLLIGVGVTNDKEEAITIDSSYFKLKTNSGTTYDPTTSGTVMMAMGNNASDFFLTQINPGLSKAGWVIFEVPKDLEVKTTVLQCQTGFWGTETVEILLTDTKQEEEQETQQDENAE